MDSPIHRPTRPGAYKQDVSAVIPDPQGRAEKCTDDCENFSSPITAMNLFFRVHFHILLANQSNRCWLLQGSAQRKGHFQLFIR